MISKTQIAARLSVGVSLSGVLLLAGGAAYAQTETTKTESKTEADATARQSAVKTLRKMGVNLDWHKATLAELKQTQADLIAAGEDEDLRLRVILAARLRESGVKLNWRRFTSDELLEKYNAAQEAVVASDEEPEIVETPAPAPRKRQTTRPAVTYELPPQNPNQNINQGNYGQGNYGYDDYYSTQQVAPVLIQQVPVVNPGYGMFYSQGYSYYPTGTVIINGQQHCHTRYCRPNCGQNIHVGYQPNDIKQTIRYQPGAPITPRPLQAPISLPGGKPGTPGAIPIPKVNPDPNYKGNG